MLICFMCMFLFCAGAGKELGRRDMTGRKSATQLFEQHAARSVAFIDMDLTSQAEEPDLSFTELESQMGNHAEVTVAAARDLRRHSWKDYWDEKRIDLQRNDAEEMSHTSSQQDNTMSLPPVDSAHAQEAHELSATKADTRETREGGEVSFDEMDDYDMQGEQPIDRQPQEKTWEKQNTKLAWLATSGIEKASVKNGKAPAEMSVDDIAEAELESAEKMAALSHTSKYRSAVSTSPHQQAAPLNGQKNLAWRSYWAHKKHIERKDEMALEGIEQKALEQGQDMAGQLAPLHIEALEQRIATHEIQQKHDLTSAPSESLSQVDSPPPQEEATKLPHNGPDPQMAADTSGTPVSLVDGECIIVGENRLAGFDVSDIAPIWSENSASHETWLVKNSLVHIQGRFDVVNGKRSLRGLAVGGPFIGGNTLIIRGRAVNGKIFWNNDRILEKAPSEYRNRFISAKYHPRAPLVQDPKQMTDTPAIDMKFPLGVRLTVNRGKDGLGIKVNMHRLGTEQDGQCGNFNGDPSDDSLEQISKRIGHIQPAELLFRRDERNAAVHDNIILIEKSTTSSQEESHSLASSNGEFLTGLNIATLDKEASCLIYGDPYVSSFDKVKVPVLLNRVSLSEQHQKSLHDAAGTGHTAGTGDAWLVNSPQVYIQGRFNVVDAKGQPFLRGIAVGGPFLKGNVLIIAGPHFKEHLPSGKTFWNGEEILASVPSEFTNELVSAKQSAHVPLVFDETRKTQLPGLNIELPLGVKLAVNRGKHGLGVKISMRRRPGPQDGQCGNFNGNTEDETAELISSRIGVGIATSELLFRHPFV